MNSPNFLIVGERRCGTTTLYHWLAHHPDIYLYPKTDTAYFIENELVGRTEWLDGKVKSQQWDQEHSPEHYKSLFDIPGTKKAAGEKSADIFYWTPSHERLIKYLPKGKFIVQLRDPVMRCWSHYWNEVGKGRENRNFEEALQLEEERAAQSDYAKHHLSYLSRGHYYENLNSFLKHVPSENLLILVLEETIKNPREAFNKMCRFLGVDDSVEMVNPTPKHNDNWTLVKRNWVKSAPFNKIDSLYEWGLKKIAARLWRNHPDRVPKKRKLFRRLQYPFRKPAGEIKMSKSQLKKLSDYYRPHNKKLEALLDRPLDFWSH